MGMMDDIRSRHKRRQEAKSQTPSVSPQAGAAALPVNVGAQPAPTGQAVAGGGQQATDGGQQAPKVGGLYGNPDGLPAPPPNVRLGKHGEILRDLEPPKPPSSTQHQVKVQPLKAEAQPTSEADATPRRMTYQELFEATTPYKPLTDEQRTKEAKREKRQKLFAAIGDGLSAMSNLYATTQGSPGIKLPGLSKGAMQRWERLRAERGALEREYAAGLQRAQAMDEQREQSERQWRAQLQKQQQEAAFRAAEYDLKVADHKLKQAQAELENARKDKLTEAKIKELEERVEDRKMKRNLALRKLAQDERQHKERIGLGYANLNERKTARLSGGGKGKQDETYPIHYAGGAINIPKNAVNTANIAGIYAKIPLEYIEEAWPDSYKKPNRDDMMNVIGEFLETAPNKKEDETDVQYQARMKAYEGVIAGLKRLGGSTRGLGPMAGIVPGDVPSEEKPKMGYGDGYDFEDED